MAGPRGSDYLFDSESRAGGIECRQEKGYSPLTTHALPRASRRASPETVSRRHVAEETLRTVLGSLDDIKAQDAVTIDLSGKSSIGDYMVVATGTSQRHVASVADRVVKDLEKAGHRGLRIEGMRQADWVLIDAGDVIVHVFRPETREFYNLEKMWTSGGTRHQ